MIPVLRFLAADRRVTMKVSFLLEDGYRSTPRMGAMSTSPPFAPRPANRLASESSPYLRLHAHNPVDWYPWGAEAIARARAEDRPIFLSVGYSTCYWCHVMERESFSDPAIAAAMNQHFVNVKVDREERPDLDEIYMLATQILAGQGGWPNSVFLTPDLKPFFAGTYFPPEDKWGRPGFPTVIESMVHAWEERRADVETQAADLAEGIRRHLAEVEPYAGALPGGDLARLALDGLRQRFDGTWGGFGEAPKFPSPANLWLLAAFAGERADAAMMLEATLGAMARGGIRDHLAGGFHRYSTDREWRVPHFEKMLYDNGLLLEAYAREHARSGDPEAARAALETAQFLAREMTAPEGAFFSAIDAETGGREGACHVWTRAEIDAALGVEDAEFLAPLLGFAGEPNFESESYVLHLARPLDVLARERRTTAERLLAEMAPLRAKLLEARDRRPRPATDDKILADWNGTAIAGLAVAARALGRPELAARAARAASFLLATLRAADGTLLHAWRAGAGKVPAFLSDYAFLIRGLLRLAEADGDRRWIAEAARLADEMRDRLAAPAGGYFNATESDDLLFRGKETFDGALPAANAVAALDLLDLAAATGEERFAAEAERTLRAFASLAARHVDGARTLALAFARLEARRQGETGTEVGASEAATSGAQAPGAVAGASRLDQEAASVVSSRLDLAPPAADGWRDFVLTLRLRAGWHLSAEPGAPEALKLQGVGLDLSEVDLPPAGPLGAEGERGLADQVAARGRLREQAGAQRRAIRVHYQPCTTGRCLAPVAIELPVPD